LTVALKSCTVTIWKGRHVSQYRVNSLCDSLVTPMIRQSYLPW
jgi:hypothetical protein